MRHALGGISAALFSVLVADAGCNRETFFCDAAEDCSSDGGGGVCESTGYCSFPDPECATGRRYGELAPSGLAGTCVPVDDGTGSTTASMSGETTAPDPDPTLDPSTTTTASPTTSTTDPATTDPSSSSSGETGDAASSTGGEPTCCSADCSSCGESCTAETFDETESGEALAIAIVDDTLIWTTGWTNQVITIDLETGDRSVLVTLPHIISQITTDDAYIYYLSYSSGFVGRISIASGQVDQLGNTDGMQQFDAGLGHLVVDDTHVYAAMANTANEANGGVFQFPKEPGEGDPLRIGDFDRPVGIGVDATSLFVADDNDGAVFRIEKAALDGEPVQLAAAPAPGPMHVGDDALYVTSGTDLLRIPKRPGPSTLLASITQKIEGITADETHVYVTGLYSGEVMRVAMGDDEPAAVIADVNAPWGIATDCNYVYWCENGTLTVQRQPK